MRLIVFLNADFALGIFACLTFCCGFEQRRHLRNNLPKVLTDHLVEFDT